MLKSLAELMADCLSTGIWAEIHIQDKAMVCNVSGNPHTHIIKKTKDFDEDRDLTLRTAISDSLDKYRSGPS